MEIIQGCSAMNVDAIIGSDGRERVLGCWKAAQAYMDAADSAKKQQLLGEMVTKAHKAPAEAAMHHLECFGPLCVLNNMFQCAGGQPTKDERALNMARLGFKDSTAFLKHVAENTGASIRMTRLRLNATYYIAYNLTLPESKRVYLGVEAAAMVWTKALRPAHSEDRAAIVDRLLQQQREEGKLSLSVIRRWLATDSKEEDAATALAVTEGSNNGEVGTAAVGGSLLLQQPDAQDKVQQASTINKGAGPAAEGPLVEDISTGVALWETAVGGDTECTAVDKGRNSGKVDTAAVVKGLSQQHQQQQQQEGRAVAEVQQVTDINKGLTAPADGIAVYAQGDAGTPSALEEALQRVLAPYIQQLNARMAALEAGALSPAPVPGEGVVNSEESDDSEAASDEAIELCESFKQAFMRAHVDWAWYALLQALWYIKTRNPDRDRVLLAVCLRVMSCVQPDEDSVMSGVPGRLPVFFPESLLRRLNELLYALHDERNNRKIKFFADEPEEEWLMHKRALIFVQQKLFGHCSKMPDLQISLDEARDGLGALVWCTTTAHDAFDQYVSHLLAWKRKEALAFLRTWPQRTPLADRTVSRMVNRARSDFG